MPPFNMQGMPGMTGQDDGINLLSILINIAFGFIAGLMFFLGFKEVIAYGTKLAGELIKLTPQGQQMAAFGFATSAAPYIVIAPIFGMVLKQLSSVRSLKSFAFFVIAVGIGFLGAYLGQGSVANMIL
ncbi:MAG: hypothetical protein AAB513_01430 [Patescibacteria group bacterium]